MYGRGRSLAKAILLVVINSVPAIGPADVERKHVYALISFSFGRESNFWRNICSNPPPVKTFVPRLSLPHVVFMMLGPVLTLIKTNHLFLLVQKNPTVS